MNIFYAPDSPNAGTFDLPPEEAHHAVKVLRLHPGDEVRAVNGKGTFLHCKVFNTHSNHCELEILQIEENHSPLPYQLHVALAPTKRIDRFEWFLEKATEIGISEITPIWSEHSERKHIKMERCRKVLISAMKQSIKAWLPIMHEPVNYQNFIDNCKMAHRAIAHCDTGSRIKLHEYWTGSHQMAILIGPEGDFSPDEIDRAIRAGFQPVTLGESRLRTETAGVAACFAASLLNS